MKSNLINHYIKLGRIAEQKVGFVQVEALLRESLIDLKEAEQIETIAKRGAYVLAYMAMLKAGRACLLYYGYRPKGSAQHKTVVEIVGELMGKEFEMITLSFERMRRKRNDLTYESGCFVSDLEVAKSVRVARDLVYNIYQRIKKDNPQLELEF